MSLSPIERIAAYVSRLQLSDLPAASPADFTPETLVDPAILTIAGLVELTVDPELDREFPFDMAWPAIAAVETIDGRNTSATCIYPPGDHRALVRDHGSG